MDIDTNRWTETFRTGLLLLAIPSTLVIIHLLSTPEIRSGLIFDHDKFRIYTLWTSAFVHRSLNHLIGNLLGFVVVIAALWPFFFFDKTQKEFRRILVAFLAVLPPLISFSDYLVYRYLLGVNNLVATRGFSGILASLFGLLFVVVVKEVYNFISDWQRTTNYALALILAILGGVVLTSAIGNKLIWGVIAFGILLVVFGTVPPEKILSPSQLVDNIEKHRFQYLLIGYGTLSLVLMVPAFFPVDWIHAESVTNIFGHAAGLFLGGLFGGSVVLITFTEWGRTEVRKRSHLRPLLLSKVYTNIFRRITAFTLLLSVVLALAAMSFSSSNQILSGATVLYASILLFREVPDQPALTVESMDIAFHRDGSFLVNIEVRNVGTGIAEDVVAHARIYDPLSDTSTFWTEHNLGDDQDKDGNGTLNIKPSHYHNFGVSINENRIPDEIFTDNVRFECRVESVNQSYTTFEVLKRKALDRYNEFVRAMRVIASSSDPKTTDGPQSD